MSSSWLGTHARPTLEVLNFRPLEDSQARALPRSLSPLWSVLSMDTFTCFQQLPCEIRLRIWELTVEPRIVDFRVAGSYKVGPDSKILWKKSRAAWWCEGYRVVLVKSHTPVPAMLHVCRESRDLGRQKFYQATHPGFGAGNEAINQAAFKQVWLRSTSSNPHQEVDGPVPPEKQYYTYVNWDIDMIDIGGDDLSQMITFRRKIQRLKISRCDYEEHWQELEARGLRRFTALKEIFIVCEEGLYSWHHVFQDYQFWCKRENIYLIEPNEFTRDTGYVDDENYFDDWDDDQEDERAFARGGRVVRAADAHEHYSRVYSQPRTSTAGEDEERRKYPFTGEEPSLEMLLANPDPRKNRWEAGVGKKDKVYEEDDDWEGEDIFAAQEKQFPSAKRNPNEASTAYVESPFNTASLLSALGES